MDRIIQDILKQQITEEQPSNSGYVRELMNGYDLAKEADEVMKRITSEQEFQKYLDAKKQSLPPEQRESVGPEQTAPWYFGYVEAREDVSPEMKAWLKVFLIHEPWSEAVAGYHEIEKFRPDDFLPKFMTLVKAQRLVVLTENTDHLDECVEILLSAIRVAESAKERSIIVFSAAAYAFRLTTENRYSAAQIWEAVRNIELPENADISSKNLLNTGKLFTAFAAKDYLVASEYARLSFRPFEPFLLMVAGKKEEAYERNIALRNDPTLTGEERSGFEKFEQFVLMGVHKFDEVRKIILEQRRRPTLTAQQRDWLDLIEGLNNQWDEAVRK